MERIICNKYTVELAKQRLDLTFKRVRLELLRALENSKNWDNFNLEEYQKSKELLKEVGNPERKQKIEKDQESLFGVE